MPETKICSKCNIEKKLNIDNFQFRKDRNIWEARCRQCIKEYKDQYYSIQSNIDNKKQNDHKYYTNNKNKIIEYSYNYYHSNKDIIAPKRKEYGQKQEVKKRKKEQEKIRCARPEVKEKNRQKNKEQREKPGAKEKMVAKRKERKQRDPVYKLRIGISTAIYQALKSNNSSKNNSITEYLPSTIQEMRTHLEKNWAHPDNLTADGKIWMSWKNWGKYNSKTWNDNDSTTWTWQIDHIVPQSFLPYKTMEENNFQKCWALSNLRPYSAKQNILDGNRRQILIDNKAFLYKSNRWFKKAHK